MANKGTDEVLRFDKTTGAPDPASPFVPAGDHGLSIPRGLVFDDAGNLYVSSAGTGDILKYDPNGQFMGVFASDVFGVEQLSAADIAFYASRDLLITGGGGILKLDGQTGTPTRFEIAGYVRRAWKLGPMVIST